MELLKVQELNKSYPSFHLEDVSFSLEKGYIMGFIGMNGAGKTTTLKSILNMVHADSGYIEIMGKEFKSHELELKQDIGVMLGDMDFYVKKRVKTLTEVVKRFYTHWDDTIYATYCDRFNIDEEKRLCELSTGMRTKYALTLALSHQARLFILDEPTSGLDPAARDELLEIFQQLVEDGQKSVLFSTHITSDLEKYADFITYIHEGKIITSTTKDEFIDSYAIIKGTLPQLTDELKELMISYKKNDFGFSGLMKTNDHSHDIESDYTSERPTLEDIMIYYAKRGRTHA